MCKDQVNAVRLPGVGVSFFISGAAITFPVWKYIVSH
jgi:hypothetical protein